MCGLDEAQTLVVLTIDTEPDDAWTNHLNRSVANVRQLRRLQELLARYGAKATHLVTWRVIQESDCVELLKGLAREAQAEIGAHLHPWENPPFLASGLDVRYPAYPHELPLAAFEEKLSMLTAAITERFGPPTSYRAGRWALAAEHLRPLEALGYEVDTSVTPLIDWRDTPGIPPEQGGRGGVDYRFAPQGPYHPDYADVTRPGSARIVEVPLSVAFTRRTPAFVRRRYGSWPILLHRVLRKAEVLRPVWATPAEQREDRLRRMTQVLLGQAAPILNISLHSSELMVDGSPYSRTGGDVEAIFRRIESILSVLASSGRCAFATLSQAARWWRQATASKVEGACERTPRAFGS